MDEFSNESVRSPETPLVGAPELVAAAQAGAVVVDVRTADEYRAGHIPGARLVSYPFDGGQAALDAMRLALEDASPDAGRPLVVYCHSGYRAHLAARLFGSWGYTAVSVYEGSWFDWAADSSRPVATGGEPGSL